MNTSKTWLASPYKFIDNDASLNPCQKKAYKAFLQGKNLFISGGAGTGKSFLLRYIRERHPIIVTATTGIAAVNIEGTTIHSKTFIGLRMPRSKKLNLIESKYYGEELKAAKTLAIDEISMLDGRHLTELDQILKIVRGCPDKPFGGLQILAFGDFFQLAPVPDENRYFEYAFQSPAWESFENINLRTIERTKQSDFIEVLKYLRQGQQHPRFYKIMHPCTGYLPEVEGNVVNLFPTFARCKKYNEERYNILPDKEISYKCLKWTSETDDKTLNELIKGSRTLENNVFKVGTQVMLLCNLDFEQGLVNGSVGKVIGFTMDQDRVRSKLEMSDREVFEANQEHELYPVVQFENGIEAVIGPHEWKLANQKFETVATYTQIPLMHAWALTIHKSQGLTLDNVYFHAGGCFATGQYYVGVSRLRALEGLKMKNYHSQWIKADPVVTRFYQRTLQEKGEL